MILLLDNYDSFTYNLFQFISELGAEVDVVRNDSLSPEEALARRPEALVISPGPCTPNEAGISLGLIEAIAKLGPDAPPLLGVCLGHQSIGQSFGGVVKRAGYVMHGKTDTIHHDGTGLFEGLESPIVATRYHSLIVERESMPDCLHVNAWTEDDIVMGFRHKELPIHGLQFHPESILTREGKFLLANFMRQAGIAPNAPTLVGASSPK